MKTLLLVLLMAVIASLVSAKKGSISQDLFNDDVADDDYEIVEEDEPMDVKTERRRNPCYLKKCKRGEICVLNQDKEAICICRDDCSFYFREDKRYKVCSNKNDTYDSECALDQDHCRCKGQEDGCTRKGEKKITLEYYGACTEFDECPESDALQFPERMKEWLFIVMEELDKRSQLDEDYQELLETAKEDENHTMAVIWKFCDLDKDPQDRVVSRRELQYTVRSLRVMEDCLVPFLDGCDANDDRKISLVEWGECLGLEHEKITDKCHKISKNGKKKKKN